MSSSQYRVVVHDDDDHSFDHVAEVFVRVLGVTPDRARELSHEVDRGGCAIVLEADRETTGNAVDAILASGPDPRLPRSRTSLSVSLEEVLPDGRVRPVRAGRMGPSGLEPRLARVAHGGGGDVRLTIVDVGGAPADHLALSLVQVLAFSRAEASRIARNVLAHGRWSIAMADRTSADEAEKRLLEYGLVVAIEEGGRVATCRRRLPGGELVSLDDASVRALRRENAPPVKKTEPAPPLGKLALIGAAVGVAVAIATRRKPPES